MEEDNFEAAAALINIVGSSGTDNTIAANSGGNIIGSGQIPQIVPQINEDELSQLVKLSCHDSGIDIRDPNAVPQVQAIQPKKVCFLIYF